MAIDRNKSLIELIHRGIEILLRRSSKADREERKRRAIATGRFHSGLGDVSMRHDEYLSEAYQDDDIC
jgi:hypothetical protein